MGKKRTTKAQDETPRPRAVLEYRLDFTGSKITVRDLQEWLDGARRNGSGNATVQFARDGLFNVPVGLRILLPVNPDDRSQL
jgi:hypothetical protein